ncbi:uncharacterized protein N7506_007422 [Penicillium brevicompactum]|uniref:uncharacterized protein n=1 Tax=Penicillium brevicompactum TaxID=5074 RepID=UPI002540DCC1|nr:uncharacterized protein N7506_007422 [Penicillium brevicompactum]KAJ5333639.1 hypothetical protein N7506_007422 [Penicillium brevicompactum]
MPTDFFSLPGEIRNKIYEYLLVHEGGIVPWHKGFGLSPNILATSKRTLHEARSILYGGNCFTISPDLNKTEELFNTIGLINVHHLRSIRIAFPLFNNKEIFKFDNEPVCMNPSLATMKIIIKSCVNVETVTFSLVSIELLVFSPVGDHGVTLAEVDSRLREIPALKDVIVEACRGSIAMAIRQEIEGLGWLMCDMGDDPLHPCHRGFPDEGYDWLVLAHGDLGTL